MLQINQAAIPAVISALAIARDRYRQNARDLRAIKAEGNVVQGAGIVEDMAQQFDKQAEEVEQLIALAQAAEE